MPAQQDNIAGPSSNNGGNGLETAPTTSSTPGDGIVAGGVAAATSTSSFSTGNPTMSSQRQSTTRGAVQTATSSTASPKQSGGNSNTGAIAGAAVGAAVGAALIAVLVTWLIMRRRNGRSSRIYSHRSRSFDTTKDGIEIRERPVAAVSKPANSWQAHIPRPADDRSIQRAVKTLFDHIDTHVDNFYQKDAVDDFQPDQDALQQVDSEHLPAPIDRLLQDPTLVPFVIKHCVASLVVGSTTSAARSDHSLLPGHLATIISSNRVTRREENVTEQAYSQWKLLSNYLYPKPEEDPSFAQSRDESALRIIEILDAAFGAWQKQDDADLRQHQRSLIRLASNTVTLVASHPSHLQFFWEKKKADRNEGASQSTLVVYPGLQRTTDENGVALSRWQELVARQSVAL